MSFYEILLLIFAIFALIGGIDQIFGSRLGLGEEFANGIRSMGALALSMVGIVCLAPVLASVLKPIVVPIYTLLGADPAMFAGSILACDMGGASLAKELTTDPQAAALGGLLTGSMLGATLVFTIPVALGILSPDDRPAMAKGILCGVVTIPIGVLVGGLTAGFAFPMVARNLTPILLLAALVTIGLWKWENGMIRLFAVFGRGVVAMVTLGLAFAVAEALTGYAVLPGMAPISEGFQIVGDIATVLAGAFPLVAVVTKLLKKPLLSFGKKLGINETAASGLIATLANSLATFSMVQDMDERGKILNIAFAVSAAFTFGDHLGFAAGFAPEYLGAMVMGKLAGGVSALLLALLLTREAPSQR